MEGIWRLVIGSAAMLAVIDSGMSFSSEQNSIEIRVILDSRAINKFEDAGLQNDINSTVKSIFNDVNSIFKKLKPHGINLNVRIAGIEFITTEENFPQSSKGHGTLESEGFLDRFGDWLATKSYSRTDHTMLLTGLDLAKGSDTSIAGRAEMSGMCTDSSLSVVEAMRNGFSATIIAHQLGLSLSAEHDIAECDENYIMSRIALMTTSTNSFRFSQCSINSFKTFLKTLNNQGSCLSKAKTTHPPLSAQGLGELYTPDEICKLAIGSHSYFCRGLYGDGADLTYPDTCSLLYCFDAGQKCITVKGSDGFTCGRGKQCSLGECKNKKSASSAVSNTCPYGETPTVGNGQTCAEVLSNSMAVCYQENFRRICCNSCPVPDHSGCEYGDRAPGCVNPMHCRQLGTNVCCGTCNNSVTGS